MYADKFLARIAAALDNRDQIAMLREIGSWLAADAQITSEEAAEENSERRAFEAGYLLRASMLVLQAAEVRAAADSYCPIPDPIM